MAVLAGNEYLRATINAVQYTHFLRVPLQVKAPGHRRRRYVQESLDYTNRVITVYGSGVYEFAGEVRLVDDPSNLLEILRAGADGTPVLYYDGTTTHTCILIEPSGDLIELEREADKSFIEYSVSIRLRKESGNFSSALVG